MTFKPVKSFCLPKFLSLWITRSNPDYTLSLQITQKMNDGVQFAITFTERFDAMR